MAISIVGTSSGGANNGGDVTLNLSTDIPGLAQDDYVLVVGGHSDNHTTLGPIGPSTAGYTTIREISVNNAVDTGIEVGAYYKKMGGTPDTEMVGQGNGAAQDGTAYAAIAIRGADLTTFLDGTPGYVEDATADTGGGAFDCPSITTETDGALVIAFGGDTLSPGTHNITAAPSGYTAFTLINQKGSDNRSLVIGVAGKIVASAGAEDPGVFTDDYTTEYVVELTIAVKPAGAGGGGGGGGSTGAAALTIRRGLNVGF